MTELTDFGKVWFSHVAECYDPATGEKVEDDNPADDLGQDPLRCPGRSTLVVAFRVQARQPHLARDPHQPARPGVYVRACSRRTRVQIRRGAPASTTCSPAPPASMGPTQVDVRLRRPGPHRRDRNKPPRFLEAVETALHFGQGEVRIFAPGPPPGRLKFAGHYSRGLHSPKTGRTFRDATPALFSFNSPLGACPEVPRLRPHHRHRLPPRDARPLAVDRRRRHQVLGERGLRRIQEGPHRLSPAAGRSGPTSRSPRSPRAAALRHRRRAGLRRGERQDLAEILVRSEGLLPLA
jgi:hypothetical protein